MSLRFGRIHPVQFFSFWTGAHKAMAWLTLRVWRWELNLEWRR